MNHFTNRQVTNRQILVLGMLSMGIGVLFSPPLKCVAQPEGAPAPGAQPEGSPAQVSATPQPPASSPDSAVGTITGQGTAGNIPKFTAPNAIGDSVMFEKSGRIGIGTLTPPYLLSVNGTGASVIYGLNTGTGNGIYGRSVSGVGVYGLHTDTSTTSAGVLGETDSKAANATGVAGTIKSAAPGSGSAAVRGVNKGTGFTGYGVYGSHAGDGTGVYGVSTNGIGVKGNTTGSIGVQGLATSGTGVYGSSTSGSGVYGSSQDGYGSYGYSLNSTGVYGSSYDGNGVYGRSTNGYAGYFDGNVMIAGNLDIGSASLKTDHPQHPATEYLSHSFVESPDMMNVYNGNIITNAKGEATVTLPGYFQALNRDFRYQLTPIGQFAQAIVGQKIKGNRFLIRTDKPNVEVSWQVTGVRNDAYARQNRIRVEESKASADRGKYLYPAGFGAGPDKQIGSSAPRLVKR